MTYTGVLATIFTGIEPAVALSLACVPFLRPLTRNRNHPSASSDSPYASSKGGMSKDRSGNHRRAFKALDDDSSEIQLQPLGSDSLKYEAEVSPGREPPASLSGESAAGAIFVKKDWDVATGRRPGS
jgi:hypothetical protein